MPGPTLAVRLSRFEAGRKLVREVFLPLPRNGRNVRLVWNGDELRAELLARLQAEKVEFLLVTFSEGEVADPEQIALYEATPSAVSQISASAAANPESIPPALEIAPNEANISATPEKAAEKTEISGGKESSEESRVAAAAEETESAKVAGGVEEEGTTQLPPGSENEQNPERKLSADGGDLAVTVVGSSAEEEGQSKIGSSAIAEATSRLAGGTEENESRRIAASGSDNALWSTGGADSSEQEKEYVFGRDAEKSGGGGLLSSSGSLDPAGERLPFGRGVGSANPEEARASLEAESNEVVEEARKSLTVARIGVELAQIAQRSQEATSEQLQEMRNQARDLNKVMQKIIAGGKILDDEMNRFDVSADLEQVKKALGGEGLQDALKSVHERAAMGAKIGAASMQKLERAAKRDRELGGGGTLSEVPQLAGRFAAYLAYSLGYSELSFLAELSTAAAMHFEGTDRNPKGDRPLPRLTELLLQEGTDSGNAAVAEAALIVRVLEEYFQDPLRDQESSELKADIFAGAASRLASSDNAPDEVYLARWKQFVEKGPSFEAHSLCSKAAHMALLESRKHRGNDKAVRIA